MHVVILRGAPGVGKSTWVSKVPAFKPSDRTVVVSADHYRHQHVSYAYDRSKNEYVHGECLRRFLTIVGVPAAAASEFDYVVVDNCNVKAWHAAPYYQAATAFGHQVTVVNMLAPLSEILGRSVHCKVAVAVAAMHNDMSAEVLPAHWQQAFIVVRRHRSGEVTYDEYGLPSDLKSSA